MADSNNSSQRHAYDPNERASGADGTERRSDPLAELARLIGQSDPFAEFERNRPAAQAQRSAHSAPAEPHQDWPTKPAPLRADASYAENDPGASDAHGHAAMEPQDHTPAYSEPYPPAAYVHHYPEQGHEYPAEYAADAYQQGYDPYDDPGGEGLDEADYLAQQEQRRRRKRLATVVAILVFAVVGGAGAYGYRTFVGTVTHRSLPPVIRADTTPSKIIPTAHASDSTSAKLIYDRVGDSKQTEHVVPREEKPVDIKTATIASRPQVAPPSSIADAIAAPPATIPVTARPPAGQVLPATSEPAIAARGNGAILPSAKKVRTVTIRPDMTIMPNSSPVSDPEPSPPAPQTVKQAAAEPLTRSVSPPPASAPSPTPPHPAAPRQTTSAPLSLSPGNVSPPAPAPTQRTAARTVPKTAAAGGNYVVQVSSQRSEADANASYRTLVARYPKVLGGRSSFVRRADLGTRGVYYRSMVGPFATGDQAVQFCGSLKAAGGQCIVHRN